MLDFRLHDLVPVLLHYVTFLRLSLSPLIQNLQDWSGLGHVQWMETCLHSCCNIISWTCLLSGVLSLLPSGPERMLSFSLFFCPPLPFSPSLCHPKGVSSLWAGLEWGVKCGVVCSHLRIRPCACVFERVSERETERERARARERESLPPLIQSPAPLPAVATFLRKSRLAEAAGFFASLCVCVNVSEGYKSYTRAPTCRTVG